MIPGNDAENFIHDEDPLGRTMHGHGYNFPLSLLETGWTTTNLRLFGNWDWQDIQARGWLGSSSQFLSTPSANASFES